ncbi:diacylglycerol kinase family protein [Candidatus Omnitrophota bacterium]
MSKPKTYRHKNLKDSFLSSLSGLTYTIKTERNARRILAIGVLTLWLAWRLGLSTTECAIVILCVSLVFVCETFNTLVEDIIDLFRKKYDPRIKLLKDVSSAAVLISSLASLVVGLLIFLPKLIALFK